MNVIMDLCVIPIGEGTSVSKWIAETQKILKNSSLKYKMHSYGTNIEGSWDEVMNVLKTIHEELHEKGVARLSSSIRLGTRTDKDQSMEDKIESVIQLLP